MTKPYREDHLNRLYELLFCDSVELYKSNSAAPDIYPWKVLFDEKADTEELQNVIQDETLESRIKILAYTRLRNLGHIIKEKELLGVIVEVGLDEGLDVLASYQDGRARYINYTGKMIIWESPDITSEDLTHNLFRESLNIVKRIGPWHEARKPAPDRGNVRISFLVSDGLYFGEGSINVLFNDPMGAPALAAATSLMQFLIQKAE
jgi:hypothetical protein